MKEEIDSGEVEALLEVEDKVERAVAEGQVMAVGMEDVLGDMEVVNPVSQRNRSMTDT